MTGQGDAMCERDGITVTVEIRAVNGRYFKLNVRGSEGCSSLEPRVDGLVRKSIRRGSVTVNFQVHQQISPDDFRLNTNVLKGYRQQLEQLYKQLHIAEPVHTESLLSLPGVAEESSAGRNAEQIWPLLQESLKTAVANMMKMRGEEGQAMADDLRQNCEAIATELESIGERTPLVVEAYRDRLQERVNQLLQKVDVSVDSSDLLREVAVYAERCDISEEVVRLRCHIEQFLAIMEQKESSGRKLEFLSQEMFREANTIGSKANDAEIAAHVIEIKTCIERIREMIQNVE